MAKIVLDTNILIEVLKNNLEVIKTLQTFDGGEYYISSISVMELYYGALNKKELSKLRKFVDSFEILHFDNSISIKAIDLITQYAKSHSLHLADAIIAATVMEYGYSLYTLNIKDFKFIDGLVLV